MIKNITISLCIVTSSLFVGNISYAEKPDSVEILQVKKGEGDGGGGYGHGGGASRGAVGGEIQRHIEQQQERPVRQQERPQFSPRELERKSFERQERIERRPQQDQSPKIKTEELQNRRQTQQKNIEENLQRKQAEGKAKLKEEFQRVESQKQAEQQRLERESKKEQERAGEKAREDIGKKQADQQRIEAEKSRQEKERADEKIKQDKIKEEQQKQQQEKQNLEKQNLEKQQQEKRGPEKQALTPEAAKEGLSKPSQSLPTTTAPSKKASSIARDIQNNPAAPTTKLAVNKIEQRGNKKAVQVNLTTIIGNRPIILEHQRRAPFFFIFNRTFDDIIFVFPIALAIPGFYEFEWFPAYDDDYFLWSDIAPVDVNIAEYSIVELAPAVTKTKRVINKTVIMQTTVQGYTFKLSFDKESLTSGVPVTATLTVSDERGNPIKDLEPVMGSFIHVAAFFVDDLKTVVYTYPLGSPPTTQYNRAGPELKFYLDPEQTGFMKIFIQLKIKGELIVVPFGVNVG